MSEEQHDKWAERLRLILESAVDFAILTVDPDRIVTSWSPGAAAIFGYSAGEIVGSSSDRLFNADDRAAGVPAREIDLARVHGRSADERWHVRKDGSLFFASGVITPMKEPSRDFVKVLRDLTDRKRIEDQLQLARDELERRVDERTAELKASQFRALQAERLAVIGQTVTTLAHEGRNALQRAVGCLVRLSARLQGRDEELQLAERAEHALADLERLFDDIRLYAAPLQPASRSDRPP